MHIDRYDFGHIDIEGRSYDASLHRVNPLVPRPVE